VLFKEKINFKMPGGSGFEPHQDQQAGWSSYAPLFVTALVCIDPATVQNGCLEISNSPRLTRMIGREWVPLSAGEIAELALVPVPTQPGDVVFFDSYVPHGSKPNLTRERRQVLYVTYNRASDGDHRTAYFADKRTSFPPDIERLPGVEYRFRV
jgi:ectoine hydroxylase-related dioxygenase (phytanoyl-CoA dioxygenase family)